MGFDNRNTQPVRDIAAWLEGQARAKRTLARYGKDNENTAKKDFATSSEPRDWLPRGPAAQANLGIHPPEELVHVDISAAPPLARATSQQQFNPPSSPSAF